MGVLGGVGGCPAECPLELDPVEVGGVPSRAAESMACGNPARAAGDALEGGVETLTLSWRGVAGALEWLLFNFSEK